MVKFAKGGQNRLLSPIAATFTKTRKNTLFSLNLGKVAKTSQNRLFSSTKKKKNAVSIQIAQSSQNKPNRFFLTRFATFAHINKNTLFS